MCAWPPWHPVTTAGRSGNQAVHHACTETPGQGRGTSLLLLMGSCQHFVSGPPVPALTRVLTPREASSHPVGSTRGTSPHQVQVTVVSMVEVKVPAPRQAFSDTPALGFGVPQHSVAKHSTWPLLVELGVGCRPMRCLLEQSSPDTPSIFWPARLPLSPWSH